MCKFAISIPAHLKKQMEQRQPGIDWSAIARQAFEAELAKAAATADLADDNVRNCIAERLRLSKDESDDERHLAGRDVGIRWAMQFASYDELSRLNDFRDDSQAWEAVVYEYGQSAYSAGEHIFFVLHPKEGLERSDASEFWARAVGDDGESRANVAEAAFICGFCEGALEVFAKVKHLV